MAKNPILKTLAYQKNIDFNQKVEVKYFPNEIITHTTSLMTITSIETQIPTISPKSTSNKITDKNVAIHETY